VLRIAAIALILGCGSPSTPTDAGFTPARHRLWPELTFDGGGLIQSMWLVTIVAGNDPLEAQLFSFGDAAVQTSWFENVVGEYDVGPAARATSVVGDNLLPGTTLTEQQLESYISGSATRAGVPPDGHKVYLLVLPPGVERAGVSNTSCGGRGGFHRAFGTLGDAWIGVQRCGKGLDHVTTVASHEIAEAVTNSDETGWAARRDPSLAPWQASVWTTYEAGGDPMIENGDYCNDTRIAEGDFFYQRSFSNRASALAGDPCVPALPVPYYNVDAPQDWFSGAPGNTVTIPMTGWSTAGVDDWSLDLLSARSSHPSLAFSLSADATTTNNSLAFDVSVQIPAAAPSGAWATFYVESYRANPDGSRPPTGEDLAHRAMVGVHVEL
jgi:hypothetical protein